MRKKCDLNPENKRCRDIRMTLLANSGGGEIESVTTNMKKRSDFPFITVNGDMIQDDLLNEDTADDGCTTWNWCCTQLGVGKIQRNGEKVFWQIDINH